MRIVQLNHDYTDISIKCIVTQLKNLDVTLNKNRSISHMKQASDDDY